MRYEIKLDIIMVKMCEVKLIVSEIGGGDGVGTYHLIEVLRLQ